MVVNEGMSENAIVMVDRQICSVLRNATSGLLIVTFFCLIMELKIYTSGGYLLVVILVRKNKRNEKVLWYQQENYLS